MRYNPSSDFLFNFFSLPKLFLTTHKNKKIKKNNLKGYFNISRHLSDRLISSECGTKEEKRNGNFFSVIILKNRNSRKSTSTLSSRCLDNYINEPLLYYRQAYLLLFNISKIINMNFDIFY